MSQVDHVLSGFFVVGPTLVDVKASMEHQTEIFVVGWPVLATEALTNGVCVCAA